MVSGRVLCRLKPILTCICSQSSGRPSCSTLLQSVRSFADDPNAPGSTGPARTKPLYLKKYHEPEYLDKLKPSIPFYEYYNIQLKGYDFAVVEQFATLVQRLCKDAGIKLEAFWGVPARLIKLETYTVDSSFVENTEEIKVHQRTVQVKHLTTTKLSVLIDAINQAKPPGVIVSFLQHTQGQEDDKYIVDMKLKNAEAELEELRKPISLLGKP